VLGAYLLPGAGRHMYEFGPELTVLRCGGVSYSCSVNPVMVIGLRGGDVAREGEGGVGIVSIFPVKPLAVGSRCRVLESGWQEMSTTSGRFA
jgi:hypothetical protein